MWGKFKFKEDWKQSYLSLQEGDNNSPHSNFCLSEVTNVVKAEHL